MAPAKAPAPNVTLDAQPNGTTYAAQQQAAVDAVSAAISTAAAAGGLRIPRRLVWLTLPAEYGEAGMRVQLWLNHPRRLNDEIKSQDIERLRAALCQIVLAHNDWRDFDGEPYPPPTEPAFWDQIPDELAGVLIALLVTEASKLPSSVLARGAG